ncbi:amino acid permease [Amycolatopsis sp. PS_44_ISF1]|uniref:APC family permease n=1 Tax=Amycolatopsis sp. PS_44_ISF1 TaxID=2974917 RepID=UPI0028DDBD8E|nr:amino acid permease [Amycolatopsis sp. PS_44_ISF1]MDT8912351.1 amino acid permease [Amycolatopsis sp. PS_44_ISF1]
MADQQLSRTISLPQGVALYLGAVIGAGVLILPGASATVAGPAALVAWTFNSVLGIPLALTFAGMASRIPDAGGAATYAARAFGETTGAIVGWFYFVGAATAQTAVALTGAYYAGPYLGLGRGEVFGLAAVILVIATASNARGLKVSGRLQLLFSAAVALLLVLAIVVAVPHMTAAHWTPFAPHGVGAIGRAAVLVFFAFFGWEAITHLSEEFRDPARDVPRSTIIAVGLITALFAGVVVVTVGTGTFGSDEVNRTVIARLLGDSLGRAAGVTAAAIALFIALGTANAFVAATSRLGYALARDGVAPKLLGSVNRRSVPLPSVLVVGGYTGVCLLASYLAGWGPEQILVVPNALVILTYISAMAAGVKLLTGARRVLAVVAAVLCLALLPFAGWALLIPAGVGLITLVYLKRVRPAGRRAEFDRVKG